MATLIQNVQDVFLELGLPVPSVAANNTDETVLQIVALMNRVGDTLTTENNWQALAKEYRFTTNYIQVNGSIVENALTIQLDDVTGIDTNYQVTGNGVLQDTYVTSVDTNTNVVTINIPATGTFSNTQFSFGQANYPMPFDYQRTVNKTQYNKTNRWSVIGPKTAQEWQWLKASYVTTGPRMRYRIMGDEFVIWPASYADNIVLGFEYQSNGWVIAANGTPKTKATVDTDTFLFPDRLLVLGTKLKYFEIKGFDTTTLFSDYQRELSKFKAQDAGADTLSMAPRYPNILLTQNNLPDTGFGNTTS
jgi:hypothetical protein